METNEGRRPVAIEGASVLVTGTARGLGHELVKAFLNAGCRQVLATFRSQASADGSDLLADSRVKAVVLDVTSDESVAAAARAWPKLDILVNNAAVIANTPPLRAADLEGSRLEMETNYWGVLRMCRAFAPALETSGRGAIVNILSLGALANMPFCGTYCASKAAALSATQSIAAELAPRGVHVAAVFAGGIDTDMSHSSGRSGMFPADLMSAAIVESLGRGETMIYPCPASRGISEVYAKAPWEVAKRFAEVME